MVVDTVWSFEPVKRCWFSEGSLNTPRKNFGLVVTNQCMFAIGGQDRQGRYDFIISSMIHYVKFGVYNVFSGTTSEWRTKSVECMQTFLVFFSHSPSLENG